MKERELIFFLIVFELSVSISTVHQLSAVFVVQSLCSLVVFLIFSVFLMFFCFCVVIVIVYVLLLVS